MTDLMRLVQLGEVDLVRTWILQTDSDGKQSVKKVVEDMRGPEEETLLHFSILRNEAVANILAMYGSPEFLAKDYENDRYRAMAIGYEFVQGQKHKGVLYAGMTALQ
ncbi:hypothetical protein HK405_007296, partial [Cladochytrium tenue]